MTDKKRLPPYSAEENQATLALYFHMLDRAIAGQPYVKAAMIRDASADGCHLANRSKQSIEFKLMNCSAAHAALAPGAVTMDGHGYRALPNYQAALKLAMQDALARRVSLALGAA